MRPTVTFHARLRQGALAVYVTLLRGVDIEEPDLASIPMLTKVEAQGCWDGIVTTPDLKREAAEQILNERT